MNTKQSTQPRVQQMEAFSITTVGKYSYETRHNSTAHITTTTTIITLVTLSLATNICFKIS